MSENKLTATDDARAVRRAKALRLRVECKMTMREVAEECGVSVWTAWNDIRHMIEEETKDSVRNAETERQVEDERLERLMVKNMTALESETDTDKIVKLTNSLVGLSARRAKLLGLDAPQKVEAEVTGIALDDLTVLRDAVRANECQPGT